MPVAAVSPLALKSTLMDESGVSLIELLVAMVGGIIVMAALLSILLFSTDEQSYLSERGQANRLGRVAMTSVITGLHSSCTGFGETPIEAPSSTPESPMAKSGALNLWYISAYGSPSSEKAVLTSVYEHDVFWESSGKTSNTGEPLGKLWDWSFESKSGSGPGTTAGKWEFPALTKANAKRHLLGENVIPLSLSGTNTIFQYYSVSTTTGALSEVASANVPTEAAANKIVKVSIAFKQAPVSKSTKLARTATFSDSVVVRFNPTETGTNAKDEPCT